MEASAVLLSGAPADRHRFRQLSDGGVGVGRSLNCRRVLAVCSVLRVARAVTGQDFLNTPVVSKVVHCGATVGLINRPWPFRS